MSQSERKHSLIHGFFATFYSRDFYREVGKVWKGCGILFLTLWAVIQAGIWITQMLFGMTHWVKEELPQYIEQMPHIMIKSGILETDTGERHVIFDVDTDVPVAIIDPTQTGIPGDIPENIQLYVSSNRLFVRKNEYDTRLIDFSENKDLNLDIDHAFLQKTALIFGIVVCVIVIPFLFIGALVVNVIRWLFYSLLALILNSIWELKLNYETLLRLTAYGLNPMILVKTVLTTCGIRFFPWEWILYFLTACGFVFLAVMAQRDVVEENGA